MDWRVLEREEVESRISDDASPVVAVVSIGGGGGCLDSCSPSTGVAGVPE